MTFKTQVRSSHLMLTSFGDVPSYPDGKPTMLTGEPFTHFTTFLLWCQLSYSSYMWLWLDPPPHFSWNSPRKALHLLFLLSRKFFLQVSHTVPSFPFFRFWLNCCLLREAFMIPPSWYHFLYQTHTIQHLLLFFFHVGPCHHWAWFSIYLCFYSLVDSFTSI